MPYENIKCQDHSTTKQQLLKSGDEKTINWSGTNFTQNCEQAQKFLKVMYKPQVTTNKPKPNFLKCPNDFQNNYRDTLFP